MAEKLDPKEIVTLEDLAISSMWEMAALVEVLEKKGLLTKQDILSVSSDMVPAFKTESSVRIT